MTLIAYHSNLYFDEFSLHLKEIKDKGFDTILFCITETDLLYNLETFQEFREYAEAKNMVCWATFWGYGGTGEAVCKECNIYKWLKAVKQIGFVEIMIDEPKQHADIAFLYHYSDRFNFHMCLSDDVFNKMSDSEIEDMPVKSLGVSNYHWVKDWKKITTRSQNIARRLNRLRANDNFMFIQGFDIPDGWEELPLVVKEVCEINGIKDFAFWSFRCTAATSSKRPVNYKMIWNSIDFSHANP